MIEAFYIETKMYSTLKSGFEYQVADGGDLPVVYRSLSKALKRVERMIEMYTNALGYTITIQNENHPDRRTHCLYACTLMKERENCRLEVRLYSFMLH